MASKRPLELLAPARDLATAREAILHGADAVYIGAADFGARARAGNSLDDIRALVDFAAPFGVKVYVTVNTIIFEDELPQVESLIHSLYRIGVDALIVQDLGILEMNLPPIALHASTQIDTRTPQKARMLEQAGFSQIVVARELNLDELHRICEAVDVPVEAFVHGALCVSYSGDCQASYVCTGRSANRGCCAQMCRLPYQLIDGDGKLVGHPRHYLSLRDLNRLDHLEAMADAGVQSFKIEGRLKDPAYVKNVTAAYRRRLDEIIALHPDRYYRPSRGESQIAFNPDLEASFNRRYTDYFFTTPSPGSMATLDSPKSIGPPVGEVIHAKGRMLEARLSREIANGDGITFITPKGQSGGFRANRVDGSRIYLTDNIPVPVGSRLFLSYDRHRQEELQRAAASRLIPVDITLSEAPHGTIVLEGHIDGLSPVSVSAKTYISDAQSPNNDYRRKIVGKLGGTIFSLGEYTDLMPGRFIAASALTSLRRDLIEALTQTLRATRHIDRRRDTATRVDVPSSVTRHDNVANSLARKFYTSHGASSIEPAIEAAPLPKDEIRVMTTRYCLRRELGACLKTPQANSLKGPLFLRTAKADGTLLPATFRLDFDCANCQMHVIAIPRLPGTDSHASRVI